VSSRETTSAPLTPSPREAGIDPSVAGVLPEGKVAEIQRLQAGGAVVAMVATASRQRGIAQSDVGFAIAPVPTSPWRRPDVVLIAGPAHRAAAINTFATYDAHDKQNLFWASSTT